ncbi:hypothetical protein [Pseudomonas vancouverensis]|uniref:Uncharacterized protein n=1 Tax=Pseudomonas vancouverensis TaxID=95300 RepID=A0A1H2PGY1_PSEVA|nr:hypothetical protein [Pseudomonas vancouverensis]KAB0492747.1 hypothetical protein F7R09_24140 [Pseudomonas vancouverensis]TDB58304.1 hypothetical protein EIY72_22430 [Pseudomonas vancouverensis]SDV16942.1 hypothetical protein SAMN05216558_5736 [Pseudomonas vancouverensis]
MLRIRGSIGDWPVDLTLEMDDSDWARLGAQLTVEKTETPAATAKPLNQDDALWQIARDLLRKAGQLSGPDLLDQLEGLTGSAVAGKRLLVRLRHSSDVKVLSGGDTPLYSWIE